MRKEHYVCVHVDRCVCVCVCVCVCMYVSLYVCICESSNVGRKLEKQVGR